MIARRYAKALLDIGRDRGAADVFADDLERVVGALRASADLRSAIASPMFPLSQRRAALGAVAERLAVSPAVRTLLALLCDRGRTGEIEMIEREYRAMADRAAGRVRAEMTSARAVGEDVAVRLRVALEGATGKRVILTRRTDPSLLGGLQLKVGSTLYDGSVRARLDEMRERIVGEH